MPESGPLGVWLDRLGLVAVLAVGVALRFVARSSLWLDEALTVDISRLPLGRIGPWLRHDGHPPLYYWMLHGWIDVFGSTNTSVRALSGMFGVLLLPLVWLAAKRLGGRRVAWIAVAIAAVCPFAVRYSSEARMYSLVMALVLALWLVGTDALERPTWWRRVAVALLSAALLWSHYWAMWFLAAAGVLLVIHAWSMHRQQRTGERNATLGVIGSIVAGGVLFLPWVSSLLYQSAHTGTPWAKPSVPTEVVAVSVADIGGGAKGDNLVLGWSLVILVLLGLFGAAVDRYRVELDFRSRQQGRVPALLIVLTLAVAMAAMWATGSGFASRYNAVWVPLFLLLAALGVSRIGAPGIRRGVLAVVLLLGVVGTVRVAVTHTRTEAGVAAAGIQATGHPGDLVLTCPDQLGPSLRRVLPSSFRMATYPHLASPALVDWVDYKKRVDEASPATFAKQAVALAGDHAIFLAWTSTYVTHKGICEDVVTELSALRPGAHQVVADDGDYFEHEAVMFYPAPAASPG
jgi:uncharacterized membrane protein